MTVLAAYGRYCAALALWCVLAHACNAPDGHLLQHCRMLQHMEVERLKPCAGTQQLLYACKSAVFWECFGFLLVLTTAKHSHAVQSTMSETPQQMNSIPSSCKLVSRCSFRSHFQSFLHDRTLSCRRFRPVMTLNGAASSFIVRRFTPARTGKQH